MVLLVDYIHPVIGLVKLTSYLLNSIVPVHFDLVNGHLILLDGVKLFENIFVLLMDFLGFGEVLLLELLVFLESKLKMFFFRLQVCNGSFLSFNPKPKNILLLVHVLDRRLLLQNHFILVEYFVLLLVNHHLFGFQIHARLLHLLLQEAYLRLLVNSQCPQLDQLFFLVVNCDLTFFFYFFKIVDFFSRPLILCSKIPVQSMQTVQLALELEPEPDLFFVVIDKELHVVIELVVGVLQYLVFTLEVAVVPGHLVKLFKDFLLVFKHSLLILAEIFFLVV